MLKRSLVDLQIRLNKIISRGTSETAGVVKKIKRQIARYK